MLLKMFCIQVSIQLNLSVSAKLKEKQMNKLPGSIYIHHREILIGIVHCIVPALLRDLQFCCFPHNAMSSNRLDCVYRTE